MKNTKSFLTTVLCLFLGAAILNGQHEDLLEKYKDYHQVVLLNKEVLTLDVIEDSVSVHSIIHEEKLCISDEKNFGNQDKIFSSSFSKVDQLVAGTIISTEGKIDTIEVEEFVESSDMQSFVFYNESTSFNWTYPRISKGAVLYTAHETVITKPEFIRSFYFGDFTPTVKSEYEVIYPTSIDLGYQLYNVTDEELDINKEVLDDGRTKLSFKVADLGEYRTENNSHPYAYLIPNVQVYIKSYESSKERKNVLSSLDDLYALYASFLENIVKGEEEELKKIAHSIVAEGDSDLEKVKKVFHWVQDNVKYIAFEQGMRGFVPHSGAYVCEKRYGDCKDMSSIIIDLLAQVNVTADYTWIGSRDLPYSYSTTWTPRVDNHMIASYEENGKVYFLDATGQYQPFGFPTSMIQGKEALISKGNGKYKVVKVPVQASADSGVYDHYSARLENGVVVGEGKATIRGLDRVDNMHRLVKSEKTDVDNSINAILEKGSNKFLVSDYSIEHLEDRDQALVINYEYNIGDYYKKVKDDLYINLNMDKSISNLKFDKEREREFIFDQKFLNQITCEFEIPEGYVVSRLPAAVEGANDLFSFKMNYTQVENTILYEHQYELRTLEVLPEDFEDWNQIIKGLKKALRKSVVLTKQKVD